MNNQPYRTFQLERNPNGVVIVSFDLPEQSQNVFSQQVLAELESLVITFQTDKNAKAILFRSNKPSSFFAGADISEFSQISTEAEGKEASRRGQELFNSIEKLRIPTLAALNGVCLGGGLEFALACKRRIAWNDPKTRIGLPETTLGILPAWGGTQRLTKKIGLLKSLRLILEAKRLTAQQAAEYRIVEQMFSGTLEQFQEFSLKQAIAMSQGEKLGDEYPFKRTWLGWFLEKTSPGRIVVFKRFRKEIEQQGLNYPAFEAVVRAVEIGQVQGIDAGYQFEQTMLGKLIVSPTCQNLVRIFLQNERAKSGIDWKSTMNQNSQSLPRLKKIGVLGGGIMGGGIAQLAASNRIHVVLKEVNEELTLKAKANLTAGLNGLVQKRRLSEQAKADTLQHLHFTTQWADLKDVDLVVEAVPEKLSLKQDVFRELEKHVRPDAILLTNTSALPVAQMQQVLTHPGRFGGWHFFNPVHRMNLVEIIHTPQTTPELVQSLITLTKELGKTPVVVKDSPGFLVNRILMPYLDEAVRMVCEGVKIEQIDSEMKKLGMPMGPLELLDQIGLDVGAHVAEALKGVFGEHSPTSSVLGNMVKAGWFGRKSNRGFYQYPTPENPKATTTPCDLSPFLVSIPSKITENPSQLENMEPNIKLGRELTLIQSRLMCTMINESAKCIDEKVVSEPWMVDLAMVLGTGFPPYLGGPLRLADSLGIKQVHDLMNIFANNYGEHFHPTEGLKNKSLKNEPYFNHNSPGFET